MNTAFLMHGAACAVANELSTVCDTESLAHYDLIAALTNALNRIGRIEKAQADMDERDKKDARDRRNEMMGNQTDMFDAFELQDRYAELILAVQRKFSGESRHSTALRYIREAEERAVSLAAMEGGEG